MAPRVRKTVGMGIGFVTGRHSPWRVRNHRRKTKKSEAKSEEKSKEKAKKKRRKKRREKGERNRKKAGNLFIFPVAICRLGSAPLGVKFRRHLPAKPGATLFHHPNISRHSNTEQLAATRLVRRHVDQPAHKSH